MTFLFVFNSALYLRHYGAVLSALADAGHAATVVFTAPRAGDAALFGRVFDACPRVTMTEAPERTGWWWPAADPIRALRDYAHYLNPAFDDAPLVVARATARVPRMARALVGGRGGSARRRVRADRALEFIERSLPADRGIVAWLRAKRPDAVLISPLIDLGYEQLHILKAARALGLPTGHLVASWDNLTNKGRIQIAADATIVWNEVQRNEAIDLHGVQPARIVVTGAQLYDRWFAASGSTGRAAFCQAVGLDPARPILLYAASSPFVAPDETRFVAEWLAALRSSPDPLVRGAQVLLRPHPLHAAQWQGVDFLALGPVIVSPANGAMPIEEADGQHFLDSLHHAVAVVGINTSVFLEAAIAGRPCLGVRRAGWTGTQEGTLHFRHLLEAGVVELAPNFDVHCARLGAILRGNAGDRTRVRAFVASFLRPLGIDRPVAPIVAAAVEQVAAARPAPAKPPFGAALVRAALFPLAAAYLRPRYLARRAERPRANAGQPPIAPDGDRP